MLVRPGSVCELGPPQRGAARRRHLNSPALARVGWQAVKVMREHRRRREAREVPSWEQLIRVQAPPWELDELALIRAAA